MFKIITSLFFSPSETSKKSYAYHKNPSAIDRAVITLISTIFKNIPFFHKEANKEKTTEVKKTKSSSKGESHKAQGTNHQVPETNLESSKDESESSSTQNNSENTLQSIKNKIKSTALKAKQDIGEANSNATTQDEKLAQVFTTPLANQKFPQDFADKLHEFHKMIQETTFYHHFVEYYNYLHSDDIPEDSRPEYYHWGREYRESVIQELEKPINTHEQLLGMAKEWLCYQEIIEGKNFDDIYYITTIEKDSNTRFKSLIPQYNQEAWENYQAAGKALTAPYPPYKLDLRDLLGHPEVLKNLILMFGLEYSVITKRGTESLGCDCSRKSKGPTILTLNSAKKFFSAQENNQYLIKVPLIHLAVEQGILSEVSFLLTKDNVNCNSYQGIKPFKYIISCTSQNPEHANRLSDSNTLIILDNPLKIAIDNFDIQSVETLLEYGADPNIVIRPQLTHSDSKSVESFTTLSDYVLTKTPETEEQTKSYIKIANLLYSYLGSEAVSSFRQTCKSKIITVDGQEKNLIEYIECAQQIKSASKVALTEWSDDLLATTASTNDIVQNIFSNFSGGTPSNSMSHIVDTIPVVGDNCFLPIFDNLAITKNSFCN